VGGILRERPSNRRRNASTGVQLHRMKFRDPSLHGFDSLEDDGKEVYLTNVAKWGLPVDDEIRENMRTFFGEDWMRENCPDALITKKPAPK